MINRHEDNNNNYEYLRPKFEYERPTGFHAKMYDRPTDRFHKSYC